MTPALHLQLSIGSLREEVLGKATDFLLVSEKFNLLLPPATSRNETGNAQRLAKLDAD